LAELASEAVEPLAFLAETATVLADAREAQVWHAGEWATNVLQE
jgi:hypothetical protein